MSEQEEVRQNFIEAADRSYEHYKETDLHISLDDFSAWVVEIERSPHTPMPVCHR